MTQFDDKFLPLAKRLVDKFGKVVTYEERPDPSSYDPTTGGVDETIALPTYSVKIAPPDQYKDFFIDGEIIEVGDTKTIIAAQGLEFTPTKGSAFFIDNTVWRIVNIGPLYSGELIAAYVLQLRQ